MNEFVTTLREDLDGADLAGDALVIAILYALTDFDETALAMLAGIVIGTPIVEASFDALGVGPSAAGLAFGGVVTATGGVVAARGTPAFGAAVAAVGVWVVLDSLYAWRAGDGQGAGDDRPSSASRADSLLQLVAYRLVRPLRLFDPR